MNSPWWYVFLVLYPLVAGFVGWSLCSASKYPKQPEIHKCDDSVFEPERE